MNLQNAKIINNANSLFPSLSFFCTIPFLSFFPFTPFIPSLIIEREKSEVVEREVGENCKLSAPGKPVDVEKKCILHAQVDFAE